MKNSLRFDLAFASLVTASLFMFMSCGHQKARNSDGLFADMENSQESSATESQEVAVPSTQDGETKAELSSDLTEPANSAPSSDASSASPELTQESAPIDPMKLSDEPNQASRTVSESTEAPAADPFQAAASMDSAPLAPELVPPAPVANTEPAPSVSSVPEPLAQMSVPMELPQTAEVEAVAPARKKRGPKKPHVKRPHTAQTDFSVVPTESIWKKGQTLNRYYFMRPNDTAETVAQMIYGDASKAEDLKAWNPGDWMIGQVILFSSASKPEDTEMKTFYEEREVSMATYTVKANEKLSDIAQQMYGDTQAWKEIAILNRLENDEVAEGTTLNVYPKDFPSAKKAEEQVAVAATPTPSAEQKMPEMAAAETVPQAPLAEPTPVTETKKAKKAELASTGAGSMFNDHLAAIFGAGLILMASFFAFRYFRKNRELQD